MTDSLLQAYLPLFIWTGLGIFLFRFLPEALPRLLGRALYWVGMPLEILALVRRTDFSVQVGIAPVVTIAALIGGYALAWLSLQGLKGKVESRGQKAEGGEWKEKDKEEGGGREDEREGERDGGSIAAESPTSSSILPSTFALLLHQSKLLPSAFHKFDRPHQASFLLSSAIGNTGFVGLAIVPTFISSPYLSWVVIYGVTHNLVGTYGLGVLIASFFGRSTQTNRWWTQFRDILTVPSLWAFALGVATHAVTLPTLLETGLQASVWLVIPVALLLMGMRVSQLQGWKSLRLAIVPSLLKAVILPGLVGLMLTLLGMRGDGRLALVLMSGMPTAFAGLILAEEYELDRELIASSIVLSTGILLFSIPLWLFLFRA